MSVATIDAVTIGGIIKLYPVTRRQAQSVVDRLGVAERIGRFRAIPKDKLDLVEAGLKGAGYLKREAEPIGA